MNKYIIITLFFIFACETKNKHFFLTNETSFFSLTNNTNDSINIKKTKNPKVFFSIDPECPLCKSYSKKMNNLHAQYKDSIDFYAFFPTTVFSEKKTSDFIKQFHFTMEIIIDTNQIVTNFLDAKVTPECFFLDQNLNTIYKGLIDDWIKELGRKGQIVNNNYLNDVITDYIKGESIMIKKTNAIGCIIERLK